MNALAKTDNADLAQHVDLPVDIAWPDLQAAISGNLAKLSAEGQVKYYNALCKFTGLNPLGFPFEWITFQSKLKLYPKKECADQLRGVHKISAKIIERTFFDDICMVRVMSTTPDGRQFESTGAVPYSKGMAPLDRCKAIKVAETQAYRRGTLGIVGLGNLLDEDTEPTERPSVIVDTAGEESVASRAAMLNAAVAEEKVIELSHEPPTVTTEALPPVPVETAQVQTAIEESAPDDFPAETPVESDAEKLARNLELVLSEYPQPVACVDYIISQRRLVRGAKLETIDPVYAKKVLANPKGFFRAVEQWVKGGRK